MDYSAVQRHRKRKRQLLKAHAAHFPSPNTRTLWAPQPEPSSFSDDEPLSSGTDPMPPTQGRVRINAIPEREAIAASESLSRFSVLVDLKAPSLSEEALRSQRAPIDLVAVLDISGSMHGPKIALLKRAVHFVVDNLGPSDRLSVVSFSTTARRVFPLRNMTRAGREEAKAAVDSLQANGMTNIVEGLVKGVRVLEQRRCKNPVSSIIFLSDGQDTCNNNIYNPPANTGRGPKYLHLLPGSIRPSNRKTAAGEAAVFPVHAFGFGSDHDSLAMHAISDESGGTFSFVESYVMVQDAFACCVGGLLSVVVRDLRLALRSASHGVAIKSIDSGRYANEVCDEGSRGTIHVGDLYADEEKQFLVDVSVPEGKVGKKTSLLDVTCSYYNSVSKEEVWIEPDLVEVERPGTLTRGEAVINLKVDRERNRVVAARSIAEAQGMADAGNLTGARELLSSRRANILDSVSGRAGDDLALWLDAEIEELESRMEDLSVYERAGRAYALSSKSLLENQRATTRGLNVGGAAGRGRGGGRGGGRGSSGRGRGGACKGPPPGARVGACFRGYATPQMNMMVMKSQKINIARDDDEEMED